MTENSSWTFYGYRTATGRREVQVWFAGLHEDEKDEIRDTLDYLKMLRLIFGRNRNSILSVMDFLRLGLRSTPFARFTAFTVAFGPKIGGFRSPYFWARRRK